MTRMVTIDLDDADVAALVALHHEIARRTEALAADPELRAALVRRCAEALAAGRLSDGEADEIERLLDRVHPGVVLEAWLDRLVDLDRPALGAFREITERARAERAALLRADEERRRMTRENPERLEDIVRQMARFSDVDALVAGAVQHAEACGVPEKVFAPIIARVVSAIRQETRSVIRV